MSRLVCRRSDGQTVAARVEIADTFWRRLRGLMWRADLPEGEGLVIEPCTSIHMMFMRFPIDAVFLDAGNRVVAIYHSLKPWWGISGWHRNASKVLEIPAGTAAKVGLALEEPLRFEPAS